MYSISLDSAMKSRISRLSCDVTMLSLLLLLFMMCFFLSSFFSVLLCSGLLSPFKQSGKWKWKASGVCARPFFPTTIFVPRYIKATHITQWKITPTHKNNIHLANALKATTAKTKIFRSFVRLFIRTLCSPFSKCNVNGSKQRKKNHQQRRERERGQTKRKNLLSLWWHSEAKVWIFPYIV